MMRKRFFLFSVLTGVPLLLLGGEVQADVSDFKVLDKDFFTNTQHTLFLSENHSDLSPDKFIKTAQVCWIMDTGECAGMEFVDSDAGGTNGGPEDYVPKGPEDCIKEGYTITQCPDGEKGDKECLYADGYYADCIPDCPDSYKKCEDPYHGVGQVCGDGLYASCECDYCTDYPYEKDDIPEGYVADGAACNSCNGPRYKVKPNPCDGYLDCGSLGGEAGAKTCLSGTVIKYSECKPCPNLGTFATCPACSVCTYEQCSSKFYVTGCKAGCADYCDYCAFEQ